MFCELWVVLGVLGIVIIDIGVIFPGWLGYSGMDF